jgi:hypothetical protein
MTKFSILKCVISVDVKYEIVPVLYIKMQKRVKKVFEIIFKTSTTARTIVGAATQSSNKLA